jgi:HPt (histidine-containing phosphotransfer) domain-containing protein
VALDVLQGDHDHAVLEQLAPYLARITGDGRGLLAILRVLAPADQLYLIELIGSELPAVIQSAQILRDILAMLADYAVEEALLSAIGAARLRELLATPEELSDVLEWVYGASDRLVLQLLGNAHLLGLFASGHELSLVLGMLDHQLQKEFIELLSWEQVSAIIHSRADLAHLLAALPAELSTELLPRIPVDRLRALIRNAQGWRALCASLELPEIEYLQRIPGVAYAQ